MNNTSRPSKVIYYLEMAKAVSIRSTCLKNHAGAVIVQNDQVVSTGYNGAPRGRKNCIDMGTCYRVAHDIPTGVQYERCLDGSTPIMLANGAGTMAIEDMARLRDEDLPYVYAYDKETGLIKAVKPLWVRFTKLDLYRRDIHIGKFHLNCTMNHKIMVPTTGHNIDYCEADDMKAGDQIKGARLISSGQWVPDNISIRENEAMLAAVADVPVYDMEIDTYHNFGVAVDDETMIFVHNCRSVHAEANAIIDADRSKMLNSTMYIFQYDPINDCIRQNPGCCMMCQRMIINAGISEVIFADSNGIGATPTQYGYRVAKVQDWVTDESDDPIA